MGRRKKTSSRTYSESENVILQPLTPRDILSACEENRILSNQQIEYISNNPQIFTQIFADNTVGSTILHQVCKEGNAKLLCELLSLGPPAKCLEAKDIESKFSPLHDALYYGNINCAVKLVQHGASLESKDHDGFTPLDLAIWSQFKNGFVPRNSNFNVMTWGSNSNYNLGHNHDRSLKIPEKVKSFTRDKYKPSIINVNFGKYHSLFLDSTGDVYSCGFGKGGRLGLGNEQTHLEPQKIPELKNIVKISCSNDHSLALNKDGVVYSWGTNTHHVLGHPDKKNVLKPQIIKAVATFPGPLVTVKAAKYHSVFVAEDHIHTCGFNGGQIGFPYSDELYQITPRCVSNLRHGEVVKIAHVHASAAVTVIGFVNGVVYVLSQYDIRKVGGVSVSVNPTISVSNQIVRTKKIRVTGGTLAREVPNNTAVRKTKELLITILDTNGLVYCCCPSISGQTLVYNWDVYSNQFIVCDISLGGGCLMLLTTDGEVFSCDPYPTVTTVKESKRNRTTKAWTSVRCNSERKKGELVQILKPTKLVKQAGLHNGMKVVCNSTGLIRSCIVQDRCSTIDYMPGLERSSFSQEISALFDNDDVVESNFTVYCESGRKFSVHKAVIANASEKMYNLVLEAIARDKTYIDVPLKEKVANSMLQSIYMFQDSPQFKGVKNNGRKYPLLFGGLVDPLRCQRFERNKLVDFSDVVLVANDGTRFKCHKSFLAARVEYFKIQFIVNAYWGNVQMNEEIAIDAPQRIISDFIYYIYTDEFPKIFSFESLKLLLKIADQYLISRLKSFCETKLVSYITEETLIQILCTSNYFNAFQLRDVCLHIVAMNIPHYLENRILGHLDEELLEKLDKIYKEIVLFHMDLPSHEFYSIENYLKAIHDLYHPDSSLLETPEPKEKVHIPGLPDQLDFHYVSDEENEDGDDPEVVLDIGEHENIPEILPSCSEVNKSTEDIVFNDIGKPLAEININNKVDGDEEFTSVGRKKRNKRSKPIKLSLSEMIPVPNLPTEPAALSIKHLNDSAAPQKHEVVSTKSGKSAWGSQSKATWNNPIKTTSLAQIMKQEEKQTNRKQCPSNIPLVTSPPSNKETGKSNNKTISFSWGNVNNNSPKPYSWANPASANPVTYLTDIMSEDAKISSKHPRHKHVLPSTTKSPPKVSETYDFNPGRKVHSLKEIMEAEQVTKQKSVNTKQYNRPLRIIQTEEMAIKEFEEFYKVHEATDEFIVIRTVPKVELGNPLWGRHLVKI